MDYLNTFIVGGTICLIGQILLSRTALTPGRILVIFVTSGVILGGIGIYEPIVAFGKAGATIPLTGFGYSLVQGGFKAVDESGLIGAFTGPVTATAAGITAAIVFGYIIALLFSSNTKK